MLQEHEHAHLRNLLGLRIRMLRKRSYFTQEELAHRIGTSRSFLSRVERGTRSLSFDALCDISDACALSVSELLQGVDLTKCHDEEDGKDLTDMSYPVR